MPAAFPTLRRPDVRDSVPGRVPGLSPRPAIPSPAGVGRLITTHLNFKVEALAETDFPAQLILLAAFTAKNADAIFQGPDHAPPGRQ